MINLNTRYLPDWLYHTLPFAYLLSGAIVFASLDGLIPWISGGLLLGAGLYVLGLRARFYFRSRIPRAAAQKSGLIEMSWRKEYMCGIDTIDAQHQKLFGLGNSLIDAVLTKRSKADVELMLHELSDLIVEHFETEEAILAASGIPLAAEHKELHRTLLDKVGSLRNRYRSGAIIVNDLIGFITHDIVANHIIEEARSFDFAPQLANAPQTRTNTERRNEEAADTVLKMARANPIQGPRGHLTVTMLDRLTPKKVLFSSYPYTWQRICVFAPEPDHLRQYLESIFARAGRAGHANFSMDALKEIGDIYDANSNFQIERQGVEQREEPASSQSPAA